MIKIESNVQDMNKWLGKVGMAINNGKGLMAIAVTDQTRDNVKLGMPMWRGETAKKVRAIHFKKTGKGIVQMADKESDTIAFDNETNAGGLRFVSKKNNPLMAQWSLDKGVYTNKPYVRVGNPATTSKGKASHRAFENGFNRTIKQVPNIIASEIANIIQRIGR